MKTFGTTLILLLLLSVAAGQQGPPPAAVKLGAVRKETVRETVTGVGTVEPFRRSTLSVEIGGLVESYPLREGDPVVADETVVCELRDTSLRIDLTEAEALLARARAEAKTAVETARASRDEQKALLDQAERELVRAKELFADRVVTQSELDRAESEATAARHRYERAERSWRLASDGNDPAQQALVAEVRRAEANLARAKDRISKTKIVSPLTGRVVRRFVEVGSWVNPGSPVLEVLTLDPVLVRVGVNERDIARLAVGDEARIDVDAWPDRVFNGKVRHIVPEADARSRSFPVLIEVSNPDTALLAGMFARVTLSSGSARESLTVPKDAVVTSARGTAVVTLGETISVPMGERTMDLPSAKFIPVEVGAATDGRVEVRGEGLAPGMPVVTTGNERLMPGQGLIPPRPEGGGGGKPPSGDGGGGAPGDGR